MSKSFARGDYRLVMAFESASTAGNWYRVLQDKESNVLSCDCPRWLHKRGNAERSCKHTEAAHRLLTPPTPTNPVMTPVRQIIRYFFPNVTTSHARDDTPKTPDTPHTQSLVTAARDQWEGLQGTWTIAERDTTVGTDGYRFVLIRLESPNGLTGTGVVAFAHRHGLQTARLIPGVAGWAGYNVAAQIAQQAGFAMVGQPPEHFKWKASRRATTPRIALHDILRVADRTDLGDGLSPVQRAENTLQLFLGDDLYHSLQQQGYLDVPSTLYANRQRVYRLRRDQSRAAYPRRIRVFEQGIYINDYCVVPREAVPEADHLLTVFLQLMTDEATVLQVVRQYNIFPPFSDSRDPETEIPVWRHRAA